MPLTKFLLSPTPTTHRPEYSGSGSMTVTPTSTPFFEYAHIGKLVVFSMRGEFTIGGTPAGNIYFTLPVEVAASAVTEDYPAFVGMLSDAGTETVCYGSVEANRRSRVKIARYDNASLSAGSSALVLSGFYWADYEAGVQRTQMEEDVRRLYQKVERLARLVHG